jgi:hypothetical protein
MLRKIAIGLLACMAYGRLPRRGGGGRWISLFNGKDLDGWKASEREGTFTVKDGELVVNGNRSHLFYVGPVNHGVFKNFEFTADVKTTKGSNSGIYFHTVYQQDGWPAKGFECQVNTTHSDRKKTGGLYNVQDVMDNAPSKDDQWFNYSIKVEGNHVIDKIDGKTTADWTERRVGRRRGTRPAARSAAAPSPSRGTIPRALSTSRTSRSVRWTDQGRSSPRARFRARSIPRPVRGLRDIRPVEFVLKDHSELFEDISGWDYDVMVLYNMTQNISEKRKENFKTLLSKGIAWSLCTTTRARSTRGTTIARSSARGIRSSRRTSTAFTSRPGSTSTTWT